MKYLSLAIACLISTVSFASTAQALPTAKKTGNIESVATFNGPMPTGVTVSANGRIFVNFPRWGDKVDYTVAEVKNGRTVAYPMLKLIARSQANKLIHWFQCKV